MHCVVSGAGQNQGNVRQLTATEFKQPTTPYYTHIKIVNNPAGNATQQINLYMIRKFSINPAGKIVFTDLIDGLPENEVSALANRLTDEQLREIAGVSSNSYRSVWKVRGVLDVRDMVDVLEEGTELRIVRILDNEHDNYLYESREQNQPCRIWTVVQPE